ncbi:MAG: hypothetical protein ACREH8_01485 [Opitutaceae bacterium]
MFEADAGQHLPPVAEEVGLGLQVGGVDGFLDELGVVDRGVRLGHALRFGLGVEQRIELISPPRAQRRQPFDTVEAVIRILVLGDLHGVGRHRGGRAGNAVRAVEGPVLVGDLRILVLDATGPADLQRRRKRQEVEAAAEVEEAGLVLAPDTERGHVGRRAAVVGEVAPFEGLVGVVEHFDPARIVGAEVEEVDPDRAPHRRRRRGRRNRDRRAPRVFMRVEGGGTTAPSQCRTQHSRISVTARQKK